MCCVCADYNLFRSEMANETDRLTTLCHIWEAKVEVETIPEESECFFLTNRDVVERGTKGVKVALLLLLGQWEIACVRRWVRRGCWWRSVSTSSAAWWTTVTWGVGRRSPPAPTCRGSGTWFISRLVSCKEVTKLFRFLNFFIYAVSEIFWSLTGGRCA